jgi:hypothetical protein
MNTFEFTPIDNDCSTWLDEHTSEAVTEPTSNHSRSDDHLYGCGAQTGTREMHWWRLGYVT